MCYQTIVGRIFIAVVFYTVKALLLCKIGHPWLSLALMCSEVSLTGEIDEAVQLVSSAATCSISLFGDILVMKSSKCSMTVSALGR